MNASPCTFVTCHRQDEAHQRHLRRYFEIRQRCYADELQLDIPLEDEFDECSHFVLVLVGDECVGGARLTPSAASFGLPMLELFERESFPENLLITGQLGEVSRVAVERSYRSIEVFSRIFTIIHGMVDHFGITNLLLIAPRRVAKVDLAICRRIGFVAEALGEFPSGPPVPFELWHRSVILVSDANRERSLAHAEVIRAHFAQIAITSMAG